jgi:hypothetical protein
MATATTHPLGPIPPAAEIKPTTVLVGSEREVVLRDLQRRAINHDGDVLLEDDFGQPWVDRNLEPQRQLVQVCWKEVCINWSDALCPEEA